MYNAIVCNAKQSRKNDLNLKKTLEALEKHFDFY